MNEAMKTASDKQPAKPVKDEVPVHELRFRQPYPDLGLPGMAGGSGIIRTGRDLTLTYLPERDRYRIVVKPSDPKGKTRTLFVPGDWAAFEVAE
jgi:hypothetical protein